MVGPYDNSLWYIETNTHPLLEGATEAPKMVNYLRPSFWRRFLELNRVMWETNAGLTERHAYDSRPQAWPVLRRGINFWTKDHRQVYLIGNPFIWWGSLCAIMVYAGARILLMLRAKRGRKDFQDSSIIFYDQTAGFLVLGWAMHFLPFFAMNRQLFIHHYLPALYFSILLLAVLFEVVTSGLRPKYRMLAAIVMILIAFISYTTYAPITYASPWTRRSCERSRILKTWDLNCRDFPESTSEYREYAPGIHSKGHAKSDTGKAAGAITSEVLQQAVVAQAGNHPFEQQPQLAVSSGVAYAGAEDFDAPHPDRILNDAWEADKVQDAAPAPEPAQPVADPKEQPAGQAILEAEQKQEQQRAPPPKDALRGKDAEAIEEIVLGGTAAAIQDKAKSSVIAATTPSHVARAEDNESAAATTNLS